MEHIEWEETDLKALINKVVDHRILAIRELEMVGSRNTSVNVQRLADKERQGSMNQVFSFLCRDGIKLTIGLGADMMVRTVDVFLTRSNN